jgi:parallel beta-helix repeat protein
VKRTLTALGLAVASMAFAAGPASATELVDDDNVQCPAATHSTIQDGVDAASPNELVSVCNGTYEEQVVIAGSAKDGVRLRALVNKGATIDMPFLSSGAVVQVDGADRVEVARFRITGPVDCFVDSDVHGVHVTGGAQTAKVQDNLILDMNDGSGCVSGEGNGVRVDGASRATVQLNRIEDYSHHGVLVSDPSTFALVSRNTIIAAATPSEAKRGVSVTGDAQVDATANQISENVDSFVQGIGVLLDDANESNVRVTGNRTFDNDQGIVLANQENALIQNNFSFNNNDQGILLESTTQENQVVRNDARSNDGLDCEDRTGGTNPNNGFPNYTTQNSWNRNKGLDADPPPICTPTGAPGPPVEDEV